MTVLNFGLLIDFQTKEVNVTQHPLWSCVLGAYEERGEIPKKQTQPLYRAYTCQCRRLIRDSGLTPGSGRSPGEGNGSSLTLVFLPGESQGQRSLEGYSPWGHKELETVE